MEKLGLNEIRKRLREFYVKKDHYPEKSASLIPQDDNSLLIINSGMAPLKPYFAGAKQPPAKRMTTCQKCIRTGDIENVGITARHGTFFEMLGTFSFGDYFKKESLAWGWEFITEELKMPKDRLWATVYQDDDEAYEIWKSLGMPEERIVRLGKDDNFWEIGLGPCGPCSEIYFDKGPEFACGDPNCKPGCDCDRYMEFWNHVFTQFSKQEDGTYTDLAHPNIDTGMGLERIACIMQNVDSIFDIDTIHYILEGVLELCDVKYEDGNQKDDISIRIITDHLRSMVFMIGDGIRPSNEGRGYVLRRLIRRAARHGRRLGIEGNFLTGLVDRVIEVSGEEYTELVQKKDYIKKTISVEESRFQETLEQGNNIIERYIEELKKEGLKELPGDKAFKLYDTYGFPVELTAEILEDEGLSVDSEGFAENMEKQKEMARSGRRVGEEEAWKEDAAPSGIEKTEFIGYTELESEGSLLAIYTEDGEVESVSEGQTVKLYLDRTPFYAESGGQTYDRGIVSTDSGRAEVISVKNNDGFFAHTVRVVSGTLTKGDRVELSVNRILRNRTARNHSATHLLQQALREVLGSHVEQSGSQNDEKRLRFDFTHFEPMTAEEIKKVEEIVNRKIVEFLPVKTEEMSLDEAKDRGAMALFGDKYGDRVRVVSMGDWSVELCGGTHVLNTGFIGAFRIVAESGIASGVRRIEAVTASEILDGAYSSDRLLETVSSKVKTTPNHLENKIAALMDELAETKNELDKIKKAEMSEGLDSFIEKAPEINGVRLLTRKFDNCDIDDMRAMSDKVKDMGITAVMVFCTVKDDGKVVMVVSVTDEALSKGYHAGKMIKTLAKSVSGGGGGRPDMAQAGGSNPDGIEDAFGKAEELMNL